MSNTHPGVPTVPSLCFAAAFGLFTTAGLAAEPTDIEKALLKRIDMLEQRLSDMQKALDQKRPGEEIAVVVQRQKGNMKLQVRLQSAQR